MFKLRIYCNDGDCQYWDDGIGAYETYDKALLACYQNALQEVQSLMESGNYFNWFEVNENFEITDNYKNETLKDIVFFPVAVIHYNRAPWDRENDCDIEIITAYDIVEIAEVCTVLDKYNAMLKETYGEHITVQIKSYIEDDGSEWYYYTSARYGDSDAYETVEEAYKEADDYLCGVGELW